MSLYLRAEEGDGEAYVTPKKPTRLRKCLSKTPEALAMVEDKTADTKGKGHKGNTKGKGKGMSPGQVLAVLQAKGKIGTKGKGTPDGKGQSKQTEAEAAPEGILKRKKSKELVAEASNKSPGKANSEMPALADQPAEKKKKKKKTTAEAEVETQQKP